MGWMYDYEDAYTAALSFSLIIPVYITAALDLMGKKPGNGKRNPTTGTRHTRNMTQEPRPTDTRTLGFRATRIHGYRYP